MDNKKVTINESLENNIYNEHSIVNTITNDNIVNNFLNKNVSLESLIESEILNKDMPMGM